MGRKNGWIFFWIFFSIWSIWKWIGSMPVDFFSFLTKTQDNAEKLHKNGQNKAFLGGFTPLSWVSVKNKKNPHAWNQSTSILTIWKRKFNKISSHFCGPPILKDNFFHNQTWSANILEFSYGNTYFFCRFGFSIEF